MLVVCLLFFSRFSYLTITEAANIQGDVLPNKTFTLGFVLPWEKEVRLGGIIGSAMLVGVQEVYKRQILHGYEIEFSWRDTWCNAQRGMRGAVDIWKSVQDLDGIIGAACSTVTQPVALLAAAWGIPVVSWGSTSESLSDKETYPTFTRSEGTWAILGDVIREVASVFDWNTIAIIYTQADIMKLTAEAIGK